jgi:hypothetical protein
MKRIFTMRFNTRQLVTLAVFGALWGMVEISLGSVLNALKVPLSGAILTAIGLIIAMTARTFVPRRGSTLFIGIIATVLKLFSIGSVFVGPMIGIMAAALIAEITLSLFGRPSRVAFMVAGSLGVLWTLIQPFFTGLLLFGRDILDIWMGLLREGSQLLGLQPEAALWIVLALVALRLVIGAVAGWFAWDVSRLLHARLVGEPDSYSEA